METQDFMRNLLPITITVIAAITLTVFFHGRKEIPPNAIATVEKFIAVEAKTDVISLKALYAKNAVINVEEITRDGKQSIRNYNLYPSNFVGIAKRTEASKKIENSHDEYKNIQYEWAEKKRIKVTAIRYSNLSKSETPHTLLLAPIQKFKTKWYITNEYIVRHASDDSEAPSSSNQISQE